MIDVSFDRFVDGRAELKCVRNVPHVRMSEFPGHAEFVQILEYVRIQCCPLVCFLLLFYQMIVSLDLLFELSVGCLKLIDSHIVLLNLKLYFLQLIHRQVFLLFNILMHTALVEHIDSVLFVDFFHLAASG